MASGVFDDALIKHLWSTDELRAIFSDANRVQKWYDFEAALALETPPRAVWLRALMAELERLANHLGDIGAVCNDAALAVMHAQCGWLREHVLRAAQACFGHRLMMDRVIPGGVLANLPADGERRLSALVVFIRKQFPDLVEVYDNTASLKDRTVGTGILSPALAQQYAAGGFVGRKAAGDWLRDNFFRPGARQEWSAHITSATGEPLNPRYFIDRLS